MTLSPQNWFYQFILQTPRETEAWTPACDRASLLATFYDSNFWPELCWPWVNWNYPLFFFFFFFFYYPLFLFHNPTCWSLSQRTLESPAALTNQKTNDVSLWFCFPNNPSYWLSFLKPLPYSSHLKRESSVHAEGYILWFENHIRRKLSLMTSESPEELRFTMVTWKQCAILETGGSRFRGMAGGGDEFRTQKYLRCW